MNFKFIFKDIRFWIFLFFILRLYGITNPPLEIGHNWRQTTVTMVARNFLEIDNNILYPRIDIAGEKTGITGMEFPLLNYIIYIVSAIFGYEHWYGRLINLIISSIGLYYFFKLCKNFFEERVAFFATLILTASIWFQFSRKIMPDTFSMSLMLIALYFLIRFLKETVILKQVLWGLGFFFLFQLGILAKLPAGYILVLLLPIIISNSFTLKKRILVSAITAIGFIPIYLWYFIWVPHLVDKFGFWHFFMGKNLYQGIVEIYQNLPATMERFYDSALKFVGFGLFVCGLVIAILKKEKFLLLVFTLSFLSFCVVIIKAGFTFPHHNYYIIPFVPVMAIIAGYALSKIKNIKLAGIIVFAVIAEGVANQQHDFRIKSDFKFYETLEYDLDKLTKKEDLYLINSGDYPTPMYFAHRRGWVNSNERINDENYIQDLKSKGLKYILILKKTFGSEIFLDKYQILIDNENYCLYKI